jgi:hypothetical protein
MFWPVYQPGVNVIDSLSGEAYREPGGDTAVTGSEIAQQPIRAEPLDDGTSTLSRISLGLGLLVIVVGLTLWWRRR